MEEASAMGDSDGTPPQDATADVPDGTYGGSVPHYGAPYPVDASGTADDAGDDGGDAGRDAGIVPIPLYGAAPHPFAIRDRIRGGSLAPGSGAIRPPPVE
jgi:hypothetical protein